MYLQQIYIPKKPFYTYKHIKMTRRKTTKRPTPRPIGPQGELEFPPVIHIHHHLTPEET